MQEVKEYYKLNALPPANQLQANAIYYIKIGNKHVAYVTDQNGNATIQFSGINNILVTKYYLKNGFLTSNDSALDFLADVINQEPVRLIENNEFPFFEFLFENILYRCTFNKRITAGKYGNGGDIVVSKNDFQVVFSAEASIGSITDSNTQRKNLGDVGTSEIWDALTTVNPPVQIQPLADGNTIFEAVQNGVAKAWLWIGSSGIYGDGESPAEESDFKVINPSQDTALTQEAVQELINSAISNIGGSVTQPPQLVNGVVQVDLSNPQGIFSESTVTTTEQFEVIAGAVTGGVHYFRVNVPTDPSASITGAEELGISEFIEQTDLLLVFMQFNFGAFYFFKLIEE